MVKLYAYFNLRKCYRPAHDTKLYFEILSLCQQNLMY